MQAGVPPGEARKRVAEIWRQNGAVFATGRGKEDLLASGIALTDAAGIGPEMASSVSTLVYTRSFQTHSQP